MKTLRLLCAMVALAVPGSTGAKPSSDMPPVQYRGNTVAVVLFTSQQTIDEICGASGPGLRTIACHFERDGINYIVMPNPCLLGDVEFYARIQCHENGHSRGWNAEHDN